MGLDTGSPEDDQTSSDLGRIYELKKIYVRLVTLDKYLSSLSERELIDVKSMISKCIDLFELLSSNLDKFKDKIDDIIVLFYKFIQEAYKNVEEFYKKNSKKSKQKILKNVRTNK